MNTVSSPVVKPSKLSRGEITGLIRHTLSILAQPSQTVELCIPGLQGKRTNSGYFNDFDLLAKVAASYEGHAEGVCRCSLRKHFSLIVVWYSHSI